MDAAMRRVNTNAKGVSLACPKCGNDVPSDDLCHFVRFYDGDEGRAWCGKCNNYVAWRMLVKWGDDGLAEGPNSATVA